MYTHIQMVLSLWRTLTNTIPQAQKIDMSYPTSLMKSGPVTNFKFRNLVRFRMEYAPRFGAQFRGLVQVRGRTLTQRALWDGQINNLGEE